MDMRLADNFNAPLTLRQATEDPGIFILREFRWEFIGRTRGGHSQEFSNVDIIDPENGMVSMTISPKTLVDSFGYRHYLSMKWPDDDHWWLAGTGIVSVLTPLVGHVVGLTG